MPTSLNKYLDPAALDETVVNIRELIESLEAEMQDLPYARPDGIYPDMTVGAVIGADSTAQWATRESTGSGAATVRSVQGAAVGWNQLVQKPIYSQTASWNLTVENVDDEYLIINANNDTGESKYLAIVQGRDGVGDMRNGHTYYLSTGQDEIPFYINLAGANTIARGSRIVTLQVDGSNTAQMILAFYNNVTVTDLKVTPQIFDLTQMFGSGNEPSSVAEFEAMYPEAYYPYSAPTLKPVQIAGIRSVGFNQWDEEWELGAISATTGQNVSDSNTIRSKNYDSCFPDTNYYINAPVFIYVFWYDAGKNYISNTYTRNNIRQSPANAAYFRIRVDGTATYNHNICINVSNPALNGQYKPYTTDAIEWTAQTLRAAGSVRDELTSDELVTRVGERNYQSGDESDATVRTDGTTTYYPLATPTTTPISPALPMTYKVQQGGSESIIVPDGEVSAAPVLTVAEPVNMSTELARIWAAIESLGYTRNTAQLSRPVSLTDIGSIDEVQKDTTDVAEIDTVKEVQE